jgi:hypothetical protein
MNSNNDDSGNPASAPKTDHGILKKINKSGYLELFPAIDGYGK